MVGTDVALISAVMVGSQNVENASFSVTVAVACLREVAIGEVLDVPDVGKGNAVAVLADDCSHVVLRIGVE